MRAGLEGKVIVITGAARGVGAAIAAAAAEAGAQALLLTDRDGLRGEGDVLADLADPDAPDAIIGATIARFGRVDGLVNAAGLTTRASLACATPQVWDSLMAVNARAPFFLMQAAVADMRRRGMPGAIVNILSVNAVCGAPDLAVYAGSKGALATLTRNAAHAHGADRIRVNGINLGWVETESEHWMQAEVLGRGPGWLAEEAGRMPLGRLQTPDEVARLAVYLLSDASAPMTGSLVDFDQRVAGAP